jgi:hypothetical protein
MAVIPLTFYMDTTTIKFFMIFVEESKEEKHPREGIKKWRGRKEGGTEREAGYFHFVTRQCDGLLYHLQEEILSTREMPRRVDNGSTETETR